MSKTPGFIIPSSFPTEEVLKKKLEELNDKAGFTKIDEEFFHSDEPSPSDIIEHYGVKGMRWGVTRAESTGIPRKTNRTASKDAKEFARAKQFYGEGAGTRRKLIKAKVEGRSAKDPNYKKAFDKHLATQDSAKHATKAKGERRRKDVSNSTRRGVRGASHILRGNSQYASAATAIVVGGALYAHKAGIDKVVLKAGKSAYSTIKNSSNTKIGSDWLRSQGVNV